MAADVTVFNVDGVALGVHLVSGVPFPDTMDARPLHSASVVFNNTQFQ